MGKFEKLAKSAFMYQLDPTPSSPPTGTKSLDREPPSRKKRKLDRAESASATGATEFDGAGRQERGGASARESHDNASDDDSSDGGDAARRQFNNEVDEGELEGERAREEEEDEEREQREQREEKEKEAERLRNEVSSDEDEIDDYIPS